MTSFSNQSKNSTTDTNQTKHTASFANRTLPTHYLWAADTFPWLLSAPWQLTGVSGQFNLQTKH